MHRGLFSASIWSAEKSCTFLPPAVFYRSFPEDTFISDPRVPCGGFIVFMYLLLRI